MEFTAGFAERKITPPIGTAMAGYFERRRAEGIANDLFATALVLRDGSGSSVAFVSCDVIAMDRKTVAAIREKAQAATGIPAGNIMVFAVHNHTGPITVDMFGQNADRDYVGFLEEQVAGAVDDAARDLKPVEPSFGRVEENRISCNRRVVMKDGSTHTHITDADAPNVVGREGPNDPEVGVLAFAAPGGGIRGTLVNFALHPTNVRGNRVCSDYPRYLAEHLKSVLGDDVVTVYANGACGNIDSKTPYLAGVPYGPGRAQRIGAELGRAVLKAVEGRLGFGSHSLVVVSETVPLPLKEVSAGQLAMAREVLEQQEPAELLFTKGSLRPSPLKERIYAREAVLLAERRAKSPYVEAEVQVVRIGDLAVVGVPVELFTEFGLEIKRLARERFKHAMVVELANGYLGYVPLPKSFEGGGYETRLARSSQLAPEAGDLLVAASSSLLEGI